MSFDSILDSARKAAEIIQSVADKLKITLPKDFPDQIVQLNNCLDVYSASKTMIAAVVSDARGGFNVESMAKLTANFDTNWDAFAKEYNELFNKSTAEQQTNVLETFARTHFGDNVFTAGSIIKNETPAILGGIVTFKAGINSFKGSYRNPEEAVNKIKTGIDSITAATEKIAGSLNNIAKTIQGGDGATGVALLEKLSKLHEIKLLNVTSNALGVAQHGMAAYGSGKAALGSSMAALGDVKDLLGDIKKGNLKGVISSGKATVDSVKDAIDDVKDTIKSGKKTIESAKATLSGLKGNVSDGQLTGAAANISGTSGASRMAGSRGSAATSRSADTANQGGQDKQNESGKSDSYVCSGAIMQCTFGDKKAKLTVYPDRTVFLTGQPMANISDHQSMYNIAGFGKCHTTRYPATGAATAANHGKLTPMPCVPGTNTEWKNGKDDYIIKGDAALLKSSYCKCCWGGIITITDDGQKDTGSADLSRIPLVQFVKERKTLSPLCDAKSNVSQKNKTQASDNFSPLNVAEKHLEILKSLKKEDLKSLPASWFSAWSNAANKVNSKYNKEGIKSVYSDVEHLYNMYNLLKSEDAKKIGLENISDKMPYEVFAIENKIPGFIDRMPSKEFWDTFDKFVPLYTNAGTGAYFSPDYGYVVIPMTDKSVKRMADSEWYQSARFYHEFGHAIDHMRGWRNDPEFMAVFADFQAEMKDANITDGLYKLMDEKGGIGNLSGNELEKMMALSDSLQAATPGHESIPPGGHSKEYFQSENQQMAEFIAHMAENYWGGNDIYKILAPKTYTKMRDLLINRWKQ